MCEKTTAIILCGGKNLKGKYKHKVFLEIDNRKIIDRIIDALKGYDEIIISCADATLFNEYKNKAKIVEDDIKGIGSISGILNGLAKSKNDNCLVLSCDMPLISESFVNKLKNIEFKEKMLVPFVNGESQIFCSILSKENIPIIVNMIKEKDYYSRNLLKYVSVRYIFPKESYNLIKLNTFKDYIYIKEKYEYMN